MGDPTTLPTNTPQLQLGSLFQLENWAPTAQVTDAFIKATERLTKPTRGHLSEAPAIMIKKGTRVRFVRKSYSGIPLGALGVVQGVNDKNQLAIKWDNGKSSTELDSWWEYLEVTQDLPGGFEIGDLVYSTKKFGSVSFGATGVVTGAGDRSGEVEVNFSSELWDDAYQYLQR